MRTGNAFSILTFDVFVENRPIVSAVALWQHSGVSSPNMASVKGRYVPVEKWKDSLEYCGKAPINPCNVAQKAGAAAEVVVGVSVTLGSEYVPHVPRVMLSLGQVPLGKTMTDPLSGLM